MGWNPAKEAKKWFGRIKSEGEKRVNDVKNEANDRMDDIKKEGRSAVEKVEKETNTAVGRVKDATHRAEESVRNAAQKAEKEVTDAIHEAGEAVIEGLETLEDLIESGLLEKALHEFIKIVKKSKFTKPVKFPLGPVILVLIEPREKLDILEQYAMNLPSSAGEIRQMVKDIQPAEIILKPLPFLDLQGGWDTSDLSDKAIDEIFDLIEDLL